MSELVNLASSYLRAEGYEVFNRGSDLLMGRRTGIADTEHTFVWAPSSDSVAQLERRVGSYLASFEEIAEQYPQARKYFLVDSTAGIPGVFKDLANDPSRGVKLVTPARFFDDDMKWETSRSASTATRALVDKGRDIARERVPQPYSVDSGESGEDLLPALRDALISTAGGGLHVVVGPAGMGKSVLFSTLFADVYETFQQNKRRLERTARPFPLFPESVRSPHDERATVHSLLDDYLSTDFVRPLTRDSFEWRLLNDGAIWMLDGLDEVIARDPGFFDYLLDLQTHPDSTAAPRIVLFLRDSLLSSNEALRELDDYIDLQVYRLEPWAQTGVKTYARRKLGDRSPEFMSFLSGHEDLQTLSGVPFYTSVMVDDFAKGTLKPDDTTLQILERSLEQIVDREYEKQLLDEQLVPKSAIREFLEAVAAQDYDSDVPGVSVSDVREFARLVLPDNLTDDEIDRLGEVLPQLALFSEGAETRLVFAQELLYQYLLGKSLAPPFRSPDAAVLRRLDTAPIPQEWVTIAALARTLANEGMIGRVQSLLESGYPQRTAFSNLLKLALEVGDARVDFSGIDFANREISNIVFVGRDLNGINLQNSDLSNTEFLDCSLENVRLEGAVLNHTSFDEVAVTKMAGMTVGDLARFSSILVPGKGKARRLISSLGDAAQFFAATTRSDVQVGQASCAAVLQLQLIFGKYVDPFGSPRRKKLQYRALIAGKRHTDPEPVLRAALRYGYLTDGQKGQIRRTDGESYSELVEFRTNLDVSPGLRALLDEVCDVHGCEHVQAVTA